MNVQVCDDRISGQYAAKAGRMLIQKQLLTWIFLEVVRAVSDPNAGENLVNRARFDRVRGMRARELRA